MRAMRASRDGVENGDRRLCAACGDVLGVYEPLVVIIAGKHAGRSSLAALGALQGEDVVLMHERCQNDSCYARKSQSVRGTLEQRYLQLRGPGRG